MKKILALVLTLAMMLTMLNIGLVASAADHLTQAPDGWTAITDEAGFKDMIKNGAGTKGAPNKFMLMNDITLTQRPDAFPDNIILDGNGYTIYPANNGGDKFYPNKPAAADTSEVTIQNVNFGSPETPVLFTPNGWNGSLFGGDNQYTNMIWTNVNVYMKADLSSMAAGTNEDCVGFMYVVAGKHTLTNCHVNYEQVGATAAMSATTGIWMGTVNETASVSFTNCTANGSIAKNGRAAGFIATLRANATFTNCVNNADLTYLDAESPTSSSRAGFVAYMEPQNGLAPSVSFTNCVNNGDVKSQEGYAAGFVGNNQVTINGTSVTITNCSNYGNITGGTSCNVAGFIGNPRGSVTVTTTLTNCKNYGDITTPYNWAGGMIANGNSTTTMNNCINYGYISSNNSTGGFVATVDTIVKFFGCVNVGDVNGNPERMGGFVGRYVGSYTDITLNDCVNLGAIGKGRTGQGEFIGGFYGDTEHTFPLSNVYAFGSANGVAGTPFASEMASKGYETNVTTGINQTNVDAANAADVCLDFMIEDGAVKIATPTLAGYQISVDGTSVRFLATVNSLQYENVGFDYTIIYEGEPVATSSRTSTYVYEKINGNVHGIVKETTAESLHAEYIYALTFINVPTEGSMSLIIKAKADGFASATYTVNIQDGVVTGYTVG